MFAQLCLALLAFPSLAAAGFSLTKADVCEWIILPLVGYNKIEGKWILHAAAADSEEHMNAVKMFNSSWVKRMPKPGSNDFTIHYGDKINGTCIYGSTESSTSGNNITLQFNFGSISLKHVGRYLKTFPESVLWVDDMAMDVNNMNRTGRSLLLFKKSGKMDDNEIEVFKTQAACLNLLPDIYFLDTTNLCPDERQPVTSGTSVEQNNTDKTSLPEDSSLNINNK